MLLTNISRWDTFCLARERFNELLAIIFAAEIFLV